MVEAEFKLILPKFDNSKRRINPEEFEPYFNELIDEFGGITVVPSALGCWRDDKTGKMVCDENIIIYTALNSSDPKEINKKYNFIKKLSEKAGKEFGQASVFVENDIIADVSFIDGKFKEKLERGKVISSLLDRRIL